MDEIKDLLEAWKKDGLVNPAALEKAHTALILLVEQIEELEKKINA